MLELPEVETIRRDLDRELPGKKMKTVEANSMASLGRYKTRKAFTSLLDGRKLGAVTRRGLVLLIALDDGADTLVFKLGDGSALRRNANKDEKESGTEIVLGFTQHGQLRLIDPDGNADVFVCETEALEEELPELLRHGVDPIENPMSWPSFAELLHRREEKLKTLLTNDEVIVGIGDIYSDEILFDAGLRHDRPSTSLSTQEVRRLYRSLVETMHDAIKYRGTNIESRPFLDVFGEAGSYNEHLAVYGREGELSPRSRLPILRTKFSGSWTYYCDTQV